MAKKLHVAVAGVTDVGRRRERNQDNVTHFVPDDEGVLEQQGALFVVCDGMGGHAAGEVAAEIGVNSLRDIYFRTDEADIIARVASAIKQANEAIYTYAREHAGMTGMGTTCVALIVQGGRGYFLNIGDSRAYLVRDGTMRQVTLDHSWVAEQVRAGVLTDEQARTHAHRNVITRSLGTQPTVSADLFIETLHNGDRVLLCSDGLHGYVDEAEIQREMLEHTDPHVGAQHLIDMANANGGPDNITALIVHLLEVPEAIGELTLPLPIEEDPEQIITRPVPVVAAPVKPVSAEMLEEKVAELKRKRQREPSRVAAVAVRLLAVAALLIISLGAWDIGFGPYAQMLAATNRLKADIASASQAASQASAQQPQDALAGLARARDRLEADVHDPLADPQSRSEAQSALETQVVPAVQSAIIRYNDDAHIQTIAAGSVQLRTVGCAVPGQSSAISLQAIAASAALPGPAAKPGTPRTQMLFALDNGILYQIAVPLDDAGVPAQTGIACGAVAIPNVATVASIAADGSTVYALAERSNGAYLVLSVTPGGFNADGTASAKPQERFTVATPHGEVPGLLAVQGDTTYVGYKPGATGSPGIWVYSGNTSGNASTSSNTPPSPPSPAHSVTLLQAPTALAAAGGTTYAILTDGSMGTLDASFGFEPIAVQVQSPLAPSSASEYSAAAPVPTASSDGGAAGGGSTTTSGTTLFPSGATLAVDPTVRSQLLVSDPAHMRVVQFNVGSSTASFGLGAQYVYGTSLTGVKGLTVSANGPVFTVYAWSGSQLAAFSVTSASSGA